MCYGGMCPARAYVLRGTSRAGFVARLATPPRFEEGFEALDTRLGIAEKRECTHTHTHTHTNTLTHTHTHTNKHTLTHKHTNTH